MRTQTLTVLSGATTSNAIEVRDDQIIGLIIPTITSGTVTIQGSGDGETFVSLWKEDWSAALASATTTGQICLILGMKYPFRWLRLLVASQGADRSITLCSKRV